MKFHEYNLPAKSTGSSPGQTGGGGLYAWEHGAHGATVYGEHFWTVPLYHTTTTTK